MTSTTTFPSALQNYLTARGWQLVGMGAVGNLYRSRGSDISIAVPSVYDPDDVAWESVMRRLARVEGVDEATLRRRIVFPSCDVARLRAANDILIGDTIPLEAGGVLMTSAWRLIRATATTAVAPRANIKGNYVAGGDALARSARMAHTEHGSFIVPIILPWSPAPIQGEAEPLQSVRVVPETGERRVMRTLATALSAVSESVVQPDRAPTQGLVGDMVRSGVSRELIVAITSVLSETSVAMFDTQFQWSPDGPASLLPEHVVFPAEARDLLDETARRFGRHKRTPGPEILTGPVVEVHYAPDDPVASVAVQVSRRARLVEVRVNISPQRVEEMLDAMRTRAVMVVSGRVDATPRGLLARAKDSVHRVDESMLILDAEEPPQIR